MAKKKVIEIKEVSKCDTCAHRWDVDIKLNGKVEPFSYCTLVSQTFSIKPDETVVKCNKYLEKPKTEA